MRKNDAIIFRHSTKGWPGKSYLLVSDLHLDSKDCDRDLVKRVFDEAVEKDATILMFGDVMDLMGGKFDTRTNKGHIKSAYQVAEYFDAVIEEVAEFLRPYAKNIGMMAMGNHEYSVIKHHETNPLRNLIYRLGDHIELGDYTGFVRFFFDGGTTGGRTSKTLYYTHGSGGNSPVTKGVINTNRRSSTIEADYFVSGHIHQGWNVSHSRIRLNEQCVVKTYDQEHIQLGTFKDSGEWEQAKGFGSPVKGGYWLEFTGYAKAVKDEIRRAK